MSADAIASRVDAVAADVFRDGRFEPDVWVVLDAAAPIPAEGRAFLPFARWIAERDGLAGDSRPLGVVVKPGDDPEKLAPDLDRLAAIAVDFPAFTDGRGFSSARILREHLGYRGELRAVGNVLLDQIPLMIRCGVDAFVVAHEPTRRRLSKGDTAEVALYTQPVGRPEPAAGTRPWTRRKAV
jgi:uncharacterized protein (DUF934 family)